MPTRQTTQLVLCQTGARFELSPNFRNLNFKKSLKFLFENKTKQLCTVAPRVNSYRAHQQRRHGFLVAKS